MWGSSYQFDQESAVLFLSVEPSEHVCFFEIVLALSNAWSKARYLPLDLEMSLDKAHNHVASMMVQATVPVIDCHHFKQKAIIPSQ